MTQPRTSTVSGGIRVLRQLRLFSSSDAPSALALDLSISETLTAVSICLLEFDIGSTGVAVVPCVDQPKRHSDLRASVKRKGSPRYPWELALTSLDGVV